MHVDVACFHCVDDVIAIERAATAASGRSAWFQFIKLCGWEMSEEKRKEPSARFNVIGVALDLSSLPQGNPSVRITCQRVQSLLTTIRAVLHSDRLTSGQAASLSGKLGFAL